MFLAFFVFGWAGDPTLSDLLQTWQDQDDPGSAILLAIKQAGATPLRSETHALFLAQSWHGLEPTLLADFNLWGAPYGQTTVEGAVLLRLGNSDWYAWLEPLPNDARIEYVLQYGEEIQLDPHNPISVTRPIGSYSVLEMPGYAFDPIASGLETGISKGLIQFEWSSPSLRNRRNVTLYLPPASSSTDRLPLAILCDGSVYLDQIHVDILLDRLILERRLPPCALLFVDPVDRNQEYSGDPAFRHLIFNEILPHLAQTYGFEPSRLAVMGSSRGAMAAIDLAFSGRNIEFCAAFSPAYHPYPIENFLKGDSSNSCTFWLLQTRFDHWFEEQTRLQHALEDQVLILSIKTVSEGHNLTTWQRHLAEAFTAWLGP